MLRKPARTAAHAPAPFGGANGSVWGRRRRLGGLVGRPVERHVHLHELAILEEMENKTRHRCEVAELSLIHI